MGLPDPASYSLSDLASMTEIPERTIRSYIGRGLLPPPDGRGRAASYGPEHLERLLFIQAVRKAVPYEVPLAMLENLLHDLPPDQIARIARGVEGVMAVPMIQDLNPALLRRKRVDNDPSIVRESTDAHVSESLSGHAAYRLDADEIERIPAHHSMPLDRRHPRAPRAAEGPVFARLAGSPAPEALAKRAASEFTPELPETWTTLQVTPNVRLSMRGQAPAIAKRLTALAERLRHWLSNEDSA